MLTRSQKEELVEKLSEKVKAGKAMIFSDYTGTSVSKMKELREELRKTGSSYKVSKKKLLELAFKKAGIEVDVKNMEGQIGVAISGEDEVSVAKVLTKFSKENKNFKIRQGVLEGKIISEKEVLALAALPSREQLLAKIVGAINAPMSGLVNTLAGNLRGLITVLRGIAEAKGN
jgi:large subunit ribosomal protein L10